MSYFDDWEDAYLYRKEHYYIPKNPLTKNEFKLIKSIVNSIEEELYKAKEKKGIYEVSFNMGNLEDSIKQLLIKYYRSKRIKVATWVNKNNDDILYLKCNYYKFNFL